MIDLTAKRIERNADLVAVLGSTGSVGSQTIDVIRELGLRVSMLAAGENTELLASQVREFRPKIAAVANEDAARRLSNEIHGIPVEILWREDEVCAAIRETEAGIIFHSVGGLRGLSYALAAARSGKRIGMANKEAVIAAGDIIFDLMKKSGGEMIPVDSEHSAIYRCLEGKHDMKQVRKLVLTASGGPFFGKSKDEISKFTATDALAHPTWKMGRKITIDSATLMNKGFEIIEAVRFFGVPEDRVDVVVHRQSIIHSMVEYNDGTFMAQMGRPDMRDCIRYAATAPEVWKTANSPLSLTDVFKLTFEKPDTDVFPLLNAAREAIRIGGDAPTALIAADEEAVDYFLDGKIGFTEISSAVIESLEKYPVSYNIGEADIAMADAEARRICRSVLQKIISKRV